MAWASATPPQAAPPQQGAACAVNGLTCGTPLTAPCCSGICVGGTCRPTAAVCTRNGGACVAGAVPCCSGPQQCQGGRCLPAIALYTASFCAGAQCAGPIIESVVISGRTGNDNARENTEIWFTLPGVPPICFKHSNDADKNDTCNNNHGGPGVEFKNFTNFIERTFKLPTPQRLGALASVTFTLFEHFSFPDTPDNWDIQGLTVSAIGINESSSTLLLNVSNPDDPDNKNNCIARLRAPPNSNVVKFTLNADNPTTSSVEFLPSGNPPPISIPSQRSVAGEGCPQEP